MTNLEFSNEFDVLYNSITSNQAPGLDEYEKSVFLTKAQSEILREYFNPRIDAANGGFDGSQKRQYDFSTLIRTANLFNVNSIKERITDIEKIDRRSLVFLFPQDYFLSVNEVVYDGNKAFSVLPISYDAYQRLMLKPYTMPVKKGVWRLFTDKKNCNFVQEYVDNSQTDYKMLTTWADQKRNLKIKIRHIGNVPAEEVKETFTVSNNTMWYKDTYKGNEEAFINTTSKLTANCEWNEDFLTYNIYLNFASSLELDDEEVIQSIRNGFDQLKAYRGDDWEIRNGDLEKAAKRLDNLHQAEAPSKFENFSTKDTSNPVEVIGKTFTTEVIQLPIAEVIGRISKDASYQLRYVKKPTPIILTDFTGDEVSIEGMQKETQCELPTQLHQEILERAVTLAKIAYQAGATATMARQANNNNQQQ